MGSWWAFTGTAAPGPVPAGVSRWVFGWLAQGSGASQALLPGADGLQGRSTTPGGLPRPGERGRLRRVVPFQESPGGGEARRSAFPLPAKICAQITREYSKSWGTRRR